MISRTLGDWAALYVEPMWVNNTNPLPQDVTEHNDTFIVGVGARVRIRPSVYVVAEAAPRPSGYKPGVTQGSFAIEKRAGGHTFQLNFSNSFGTTLAQIARGGPVDNDWFMGFNISRKFFNRKSSCVRPLDPREEADLASLMLRPAMDTLDDDVQLRRSRNARTRALARRASARCAGRRRDHLDVPACHAGAHVER